LFDTVITSEAKQSISPRKKEWIASSRSLSSGAHSRDPLAPRMTENYRLPIENEKFAAPLTR
jgi:hypothetical protein